MKKMWDQSTDMGRLLLAAKAKYQHVRSFADIARLVDVSEQTLTNWKKRGIPSGSIFDLSDKFDCNPRWLATGKGEMKEKNLNPFQIDLSNITAQKAEHITDVVEMPNEEFQSEKTVFDAVVKNAKDRKKSKE